MAIIYLSRLYAGINLPTLSRPSAVRSLSYAQQKIERAALQRNYTWHFSMQGLPAIDVAIKSRELLPHVFTLARPAFAKAMAGKAVILCGTVSSRLLHREPRYSWGALLCAVRTFLLDIRSL